MGLMALIGVRQAAMAENKSYAMVGTSVHKPEFPDACVAGLVVFGIVWTVFLLKNRTARWYQAACDAYFMQRTALLQRLEDALAAR